MTKMEDRTKIKHLIKMLEQLDPELTVFAFDGITDRFEPFQIIVEKTFHSDDGKQFDSFNTSKRRRVSKRGIAIGTRYQGGKGDK